MSRLPITSHDLAESIEDLVVCWVDSQKTKFRQLLQPTTFWIQSHIMSKRAGLKRKTLKVTFYHILEHTQSFLSWKIYIFVTKDLSFLPH